MSTRRRMPPAQPVEPAILCLKSLRDATPAQKWRARRDTVILIAAHKGVSQRVLADVFHLPRSRIAAIIKTMRAKFAHVDPHKSLKGNGAIY